MSELCGYGRGKKPGLVPCESPGVVRVVFPRWDRNVRHQEADLCVPHAALATKQEAQARAENARRGATVPRCNRVRWAWWSTVVNGVEVARIDALRARWGKRPKSWSGGVVTVEAATLEGRVTT